MTLRERLSDLFQYSIGSTPIKAYLESMNSMGKVNAKTQLELLTLILEYLEEVETPKKNG
jgi:hypothetical protein